MAHYIINKLIIELIDNDMIKKIKEVYKEFLKSNKYPLNENGYNSDSFSNNGKNAIIY